MYRIIVAWLFLSAGAFGQEWPSRFGTLINTVPEAEQDSLIGQIVSAKPDWRDVAAEIRSVPFRGTITGQVIADSTTCLDGVTRPYVVYVPSSYDPKTPTALLVHLHGLVGRPLIEPNPNEYIGNAAIMAEAERRGWLVLFPFGHKGATWFDEVGMTNIVTLVRTTKSAFNVDDNRVYLSGLSDGASAAFLLAMTKPNDFAAYAAINGSMGIGSEDGGFSTYAVNMANAHLFVATADRDTYYPTGQMERTVAMAEKAGADISYHRLTGEHIPTMVNFDYPAMLDYLKQYVRNPSPDTIVWETATPEFGACKWLAIDETTTEEPTDWHVDYNVALIDSTVAIGFQSYDTFPGPGVMVASVSKGDYVSGRIGLKAHDVILKGNGVAIGSLADISALKSTLRRGSEVTLVVRRAGKEVVLHGRVPPPRNYFIFRRDQPSALVKAVHTGNQFDLQGSRVGAIRILVCPDMVDLNKNVVVTFNGQKMFDSKVAPDIGYMLRTYLANRDRQLMFVNEIALRLTE